MVAKNYFLLPLLLSIPIELGSEPMMREKTYREGNVSSAKEEIQIKRAGNCDYIRPVLCFTYITILMDRVTLNKAIAL